jgi:hypothetical protein
MTTPAAPPPYAAWIRAYVRRAAEGYGLRGQCVFAAFLMREEFPELEITPGRVWLADGTGHCHTWLVTPAGEVLDPTQGQFDSEPVRYVPLADEDPPPTGQCFECNAYRYGASRYCSKRCARRWRSRPLEERDRLEGWILVQMLAGVG